MSRKQNQWASIWIKYFERGNLAQNSPRINGIALIPPTFFLVLNLMLSSSCFSPSPFSVISFSDNIVFSMFFSFSAKAEWRFTNVPIYILSYCMTISCEENLKSASGMHGILRTNIELYISIHGTVSHGVFSLEEPSERVKGHEMVGIKKTCTAT